MSLRIDVPADLEQRIREEANKRGQAVSDYVRPALEALVGPASISPDGERESLSELFAGVWRRIPDEEREGLPTDLAEQHDHYIYDTSHHQP